MLFRIFDEDDDGCIHAGDLVEVLTNLGEKLTKSEARKLVQMANKKDGGLIDYEGRDRRSLGSILKVHKRKKKKSVLTMANYTFERRHMWRMQAIWTKM